ncbi:MAG: tetratricopeptide repeat protein [Leptospiraceae bacterium]|nr:tetratricopeptide repeat protein [Leptospiraceae bacterium]
MGAAVLFAALSLAGCGDNTDGHREIFAQALQAYEAQHLDQAEDLFAKLSTSSVYQPGAGIMQAKCLFYLNRSSEAQSLLESLVDDYPANAAIHHWLGRIYLRDSKNLEGAAREFQKAIELDETPFESQYYLARIYEQQGQIKDALLEYNRAVSARERFDKIHHALADLYGRVGMDERARRERRNIPPGSPFYQKDSKPKKDEDKE